MILPLQAKSFDELTDPTNGEKDTEFLTSSGPFFRSLTLTCQPATTQDNWDQINVIPRAFPLRLGEVRKALGTRLGSCRTSDFISGMVMT